MAAQTRGIHLAFGGNRPLLLQGHQTSHGPSGSPGQDLTVVPGGITHIRLSFTALMSLDLLVLFPHPSVSLFLGFLRLLAPLSV